MANLGGGFTGQPDPAGVAPTVGTVDVNVTPDISQTWTLTGPSYPGGYAGTGDETLPDLDPGAYTVSFDVEAGYTTPGDDGGTLVAGNTLMLAGVYAAITTGDVTVTPTEATAEWTLTGPGYNSGLQTGTQTLVGLDYDTYTATFDDNLLGFTSPAPDVDTLSAPTLDLTGQYNARSTYTVNVSVLEDGGAPGADFGPWSITQEQSFPFTATGDSDTNTTPVAPSVGDFYTGRTYALNFFAETGYATPSPVAITVTGTFEGDYLTQVGLTSDVMLVGHSLMDYLERDNLQGIMRSMGHLDVQVRLQASPGAELEYHYNNTIGTDHNAQAWALWELETPGGYVNEWTTGDPVDPAAIFYNHDTDVLLMTSLIPAQAHMLDAGMHNWIGCFDDALRLNKPSGISYFYEGWVWTDAPGGHPELSGDSRDFRTHCVEDHDLYYQQLIDWANDPSDATQPDWPANNYPSNTDVYADPVGTGTGADYTTLSHTTRNIQILPSASKYMVALYDDVVTDRPAAWAAEGINSFNDLWADTIHPSDDCRFFFAAAMASTIYNIDVKANFNYVTFDPVQTPDIGDGKPAFAHEYGGPRTPAPEGLCDLWLDVVQGVWEVSAHVQVNIANAPQTTTWTLHGPDGYELEGAGTTTVNDIKPGDYTLTWGWMEDYVPPAPYDEYPWTTSAQTAWSFNTVASREAVFQGDYTSRTVPAKALRPLGQHPPKDVDRWGSAIYTNAMESYLPWSGSPTLDADGWPETAPTYTATDLWGDDSLTGIQTFWVFWEGNGTLSLSGGNGGSGLGPSALTDAGGATGLSFTFGVMDSQVSAAGPVLDVNITATNASPNHLRNIRIVHEDRIGDYTSVAPGGGFLTPTCHRIYGMNSCARLMGHEMDVKFWAGPESSSGDESTDISTLIYTDGGGFLPGRQLDTLLNDAKGGPSGTVQTGVQHQIDIANALDQDLWLSMPPFENDVLRDQIFNMVEATHTGVAGTGGLRSGLKLFLEWSNENWNWSYIGFTYGVAMGRFHSGVSTDQGGNPYPLGDPNTPGFADMRPGAGGASDQDLMNRYSAYRLWDMTVAYRADHPSRHVVANWGGQVNWPGNSYVAFRVQPNPDTNSLVSFDGGLTSFASHVDGYTVAHYTSIPVFPGHPTDPAQFEAAAQTFFDDWEIQIHSTAFDSGDLYFLQEAEALRDNLNAEPGVSVQLTAYEAGQHLIVYGDHTAHAFTTYLNEHPRIYDIYRQNYDTWKAAGGTLLCHLNGPNTWGNDIYFNDHFGIMNTINQPIHTAYKYAAHVDWSHDNPTWYTI